MVLRVDEGSFFATQASRIWLETEGPGIVRRDRPRVPYGGTSTVAIWMMVAKALHGVVLEKGWQNQRRHFSQIEGGASMHWLPVRCLV